MLREIDVGRELIFFADEGGAWQVGTDWNLLLPVYLEVLAATAGAAEFAERVVALVGARDLRRERDRSLEAARGVADEAQVAALEGGSREAG